MPAAATPATHSRVRGAVRAPLTASPPATPRHAPLQVHEFETVEGQEWWHNDACSSQVSVRVRMRVRVRVRVRVSARGGTA